MGGINIIDLITMMMLARDAENNSAGRQTELLETIINNQNKIIELLENSPRG